MTTISTIFAITLSLSIQSLDPTIQEMNKAVLEASRAVEDAAKAPRDEAAEELASRERVAEIDATMRLVASDPQLGERLPLPRFVRREQLQAAMLHNTAWIAGSVRADRIDALIEAADNTGRRLYYEWSCRTGRERQAAEAFFEVLDANLTSYPQRLLLKRNLDEREILGYGREKRCTTQALETWRQRQAESLRRATL